MAKVIDKLKEALGRIIDGDQEDGYHVSTCFEYCDCYKQIADKALYDLKSAEALCIVDK